MKDLKQQKKSSSQQQSQPHIPKQEDFAAMLINKKAGKSGGANSGNKSKIFNQIVTLHQQ
jgi:hypothetical protein